MDNILPDIKDNEILNDFNKEGKIMVVFVNPKSGSNEGKKLLDLFDNYNNYKDNTYLMLHFPYKGNLSSKETTINSDLIENDNNNTYTIFAFNILNNEDKNKGFEFCKFYFNKYKKNYIKVLIAGGDGTVLGIAKDIKNYGIDLNKIYFGPIPFGTGNDLSNSLGFGNSLTLSSKLNSAQRVFDTYNKAQASSIDIWDVTLDLKQNGNIRKVSKSSEIIIMDPDKNEPISQFKTTIINYLSIGFDARVGFNFEQNRSKNRFCNKIIYGWIGFVKSCFCCCSYKTKITDVVDNFYTEEQPKYDINKFTNTNNKKNIDSNINNKKEALISDTIPEVENTDSSMKETNNSMSSTTIFDLTDNPESVKLKGEPMNIICQNINFYMGGVRDIWEQAGNSISTTISNAEKEDLNNYKKEVLNSFSAQKSDDKKLEFFSYEYGFELGLELVAGGLADKLFQGYGPFIMNFKHNPNEEESKKMEKVYLNTDGEFYHLVNPQKLRIEHSKLIEGGQLKILRNYSN